MPAEPKDELALRRALALMRKRLRPGPSTVQARHKSLKRAPPPPVAPAHADDVQLDELERQLLAKSRALETLNQRHEAAVRRLEQQAARQLAEIERLRGKVDQLQASPTRGQTALRRAETLHGRYARHRAHPLVDDALDMASTPLHLPESSMDAPLFTRTNFQPTFKPSPDAVYDITDFLALHDRAFVRAAYLAILRREPDPEGAENYVGLVRAGEPKARLLRDFLHSEEGRGHHTEIRGLDAHLRVLRLCELPLVGRWIAAVLFLANVNGHLRDLRVLENHVIRIAEESQAVHEANLSKLRSISK